MLMAVIQEIGRDKGYRNKGRELQDKFPEWAKMMGSKQTDLETALAMSRGSSSIERQGMAEHMGSEEEGL